MLNDKAQELTNIRDLAKANGVRCIGLGQMLVEIGALPAIRKDCETYRERFPDGKAAFYHGEPVTAIDMVFDEANFPFYRTRIIDGNMDVKVVELDDGFSWT